MAKMPRVRVVIPTYNRAAILTDALHSVNRQSFRDFEVVVVDDGSEDGTAELLEGWSQQQNQLYVIRQKNSGVAIARNAAISLPGDYEYVAFLDSDDVWADTHLEDSISALDSYADSPLVCGRRLVFDPNGAISKGLHEEWESDPMDLFGQTGDALPNARLLDQRRCQTSLFRGIFSPWTSSVVVRRSSVSREFWFCPELRVMEDVDFYLDLAVRPFIYLTAVQGYYRIFGENLTQSKDLASPKALISQQNVYLFNKRKIRLCRSFSDYFFLRREISSTCYLMGQCMAEQGKERNSRGYYLRSLLNYPSFLAFGSFVSSHLPPSLRRYIRTALFKKK
jgi:glycosyltransferase involved in cell wall biosynthesis